ncbi:hypothetical protein [Paraglaciecola marina]|uniref:hypothetical protein n=1 Tax=Paraglaciecola marina TaxID=2500157 RepID=UPI001980773C|nr:hypothetical protein [Paraglaciecola marina]
MFVIFLKSIEKQLNEFVEQSESGNILRSIPDIGVINASALLAAIDKGQAFNNVAVAPSPSDTLCSKYIKKPGPTPPSQLA